MTSENMLLLQPAPASWTAATPIPANASADTQTALPGDPAQFLQALLAQLNSGQLKLNDGTKPGQNPIPANLVNMAKDALPDTLKRLLKDSPPQTQTVAEPASEAGNSLPDSGKDASATPEQLLAYLAQWLIPQAAATPAEATPSTGDTSTPSPATVTASSSDPQADLAQLLQAAGIRFDLQAPAAEESAVVPAQTAIAPDRPASSAAQGADTPTVALPVVALPIPAMMVMKPTAETVKPEQTLASIPVEDNAKTLTDLERINRSEASLQTPALGSDTATLAMPPSGAGTAPIPDPNQTAAQTLSAPSMSAITTAARVAADSAPELAKPIQTQVGQPGWSQELGDRIVWMTGRQGLQTAELKLNPAHLGPLEVRIDMRQDQASVQFVSNHAAVREALESAVPKLREMLHGQNVQLADVSVAQQSFHDQRRNDQPTAQFDFGGQSSRQRDDQGFETGNDRNTTPTATTAVETKLTGNNGLLSLYA